MANYKKSFNFRNGVQVDDDNFIINANGLVGIGTSIPTELLDVYGGTVKVTGLITSTSFFTENSTIVNLNVEEGINASGIITGSIFYGSGSGLTDVYAIAVDGWNVTGETISTSHRIGIGTTNPTYQFQVGNDPVNTDFEGLSIDINGNLYSSGDFSFSNANVSGLTTTKDLVVTGISTLDSLNVSGLTTTKDLIVTGVSTTGSLNVSGLTTTKDLIVTGISTLDSLNVSGLTTTKDLIVTGVSTTGSLNVSGLTTTKDLIVTGISTLDSLNVLGLIATDELHVNNTISGIANTALGLSGTPNINVGVITASRIEIASNKLVIDSNGNANYSGVVTANNFIGSLHGIASTASSIIENINIEVGIATVNNGLYSNLIGIGTNSPNSDLHLRKNSLSRIQITSDSEESSLVIGRSVNTQDKTASLRFGNTNNIFPYSDSRSLDIINYDNGNINFYLESGTIGINTGSFHWHRRPNFSNLMTLTYDGKLGIGITNPSEKFHIDGNILVSLGSSITSESIFGDNIFGNSFVKVGGSSTQFLKANGDITYFVEGTGITINSSENSTTIGISPDFVSGSGGGDSFWEPLFGGIGISTSSAVGIAITDGILLSPLQVQRFGVEPGFGTFTAYAGISSVIDGFFNIPTDSYSYNFKSIEYTLHLENGNNIQSQKVLIMQNGTDAYTQEYAIMYHPNKIVSFGSTINSGFFELNATPEIGISGVITFRYVRQTLF